MIKKLLLKKYNPIREDIMNGLKEGNNLLESDILDFLDDKGMKLTTFFQNGKYKYFIREEAKEGFFDTRHEALSEGLEKCLDLMLLEKENNLEDDDESNTNEAIADGYIKGKYIKVKEVKNPNVDEYKFEVIESANSVSMLVVDEENDKVLTVKQWRAGAGKELVGLPAGMVDKNEDPKKAAIRETLEETGVSVKDVEKLCSYYKSAGTTTEKATLFFGKVENKNGTQNLDEHENIEVEWMSMSEFKKVCESGEAGSMGMLSMEKYLKRERVGIFRSHYTFPLNEEIAQVFRVIEEFKLDKINVVISGDDIEDKLEMYKEVFKTHDNIDIKGEEVFKTELKDIQNPIIFNFKKDDIFEDLVEKDYRIITPMSKLFYTYRNIEMSKQLKDLNHLELSVLKRVKSDLPLDGLVPTSII